MDAATHHTGAEKQQRLEDRVNREMRECHVTSADAECQHHQSDLADGRIRQQPFDVALRRFKRTIEKLGLLTDLRAREFYEKPTAERKRKKAAAVKRHYKRVRSMQLPKKLY